MSPISIPRRHASCLIPQRRVLQISSDRDDRMEPKIKTQKKSLGLPTKPKTNRGPKINPPKNPKPNFQAVKILRRVKCYNTKSYHLFLIWEVIGCTLFTEMHGQDARALPRILDCFEYPKKSYLIQAIQRNTCQIFLPKKILESKNSNPKNHLIIPIT